MSRARCFSLCVMSDFYICLGRLARCFLRRYGLRGKPDRSNAHRPPCATRTPTPRHAAYSHTHSHNLRNYKPPKIRGDQRGRRAEARASRRICGGVLPAHRATRARAGPSPNRIRGVCPWEIERVCAEGPRAPHVALEGRAAPPGRRAGAAQRSRARRRRQRACNRRKQCEHLPRRGHETIE